MTGRRDQPATALLTVEAAAERLSTSPRFIRRLIAERRIEFVKVVRHVRISESARRRASSRLPTPVYGTR